MKQVVWAYIDEVRDAVDTMLAMVDQGGLSLEHLDAIKSALRICKKSRFIQEFFNEVRKRRPALLKLFVNFIPDSQE